MIRETAQATLGTTALHWEGRDIDVGPPFRRWAMSEAVRELNPRDRATPRSAIAPRWRAHCDAARHPRQAGLRLGQAAARDLRGDGRGDADPADLHHPVPDRGLAARAREATPIRASPTASSCSSARKELANGFSELNDPEDQAERFLRPGRRPRTPATTRRCTSTPTTSARSNTACRRPAGSASASTGW